MNRPNTASDKDEELDEEFDEKDGDDGEDSETSGDNAEKKDDDDGESQKKQSNFKALYKKVKEQERLIKELQASKSVPEKKEAKMDVETRMFFFENPDAKEFKEKILDIQSEFGGKISLERAYKLAMAEAPKKSESYEDEDFETRGERKDAKKKKNIGDVHPEDALKLSKEEQAEWRKINGTNPNVWEKKFGKKK